MPRHGVVGPADVLRVTYYSAPPLDVGECFMPPPTLPLLRADYRLDVASGALHVDASFGLALCRDAAVSQRSDDAVLALADRDAVLALANAMDLQRVTVQIADQDSGEVFADHAGGGSEQFLAGYPPGECVIRHGAFVALYDKLNALLPAGGPDAGH